MSCYICCILTFDRAGYTCCVNNVIAGQTWVNKRKHVSWETTGIRGRFEIIYKWLTADSVSLARVSLRTGVLYPDSVSHEDWPPGAW